MRNLLSESCVPKMQIGFLPFIPNPVTDPSTVYSDMKNFVALAEHFNQNAIPVFCDEGVFRLVLNIFLKKQSEFNG